ncbi:molybdate ABC transporter substrate-binding protein [uncultured Veillonella sp.]|uniref:molybdate ABC transporter substrate-binding protein n=1 Tax=uncultured Veillonella sp. TaxID=159268 RepID=UPI00262DBBF0|nr:molybdate ABC transporter substrate-binding protein [uncultured Veillonella sp.]
MNWKNIYRLVVVLLLGVMFLVLGGCSSFDSSNSGSSASTGATELGNQKITVSAAASLQAALTELKANFIKAHNLKEEQIAINFGGSGTLRQQIEQGAPVSLFISADEKNMKLLEDKGLVTQVQPFTANSLVLITQQGHEKITIEQLPQVQRLALGTIETVPAGRYAQETLSHLNLWNQVEPCIVYGKDVKSVAAYVAEGSAEAGFVYKTDALDLKDKVQIADTAPAQSHTPIIYPLAVVPKYDNSLTQSFYTYLTSNEAQQVLQKYGFTTP